MTHRTTDVLVVGGGPAGSTVAGLLARAGRAVTLIDRSRFPRPKPCGECLNPGAVLALGRLGLLDLVESLQPTPLTGWTVRTHGVEVSSTFGTDPYGLGVSRTRLDAALLAHARLLGVTVLEGARAEHVERGQGPSHPPRVEVRTPGGDHDTWRPRLLIGADGLRSRVAGSLGLRTRPPRLGRASFTFHLRGPRLTKGSGTLDVRDGTTLGMAPLQDGLWNATLVVPTGERARRVAADPIASLRQVLDHRFAEASAWPLAGGPWASGPFDRPVRRAWHDGVLLVGDAAGYFDPFTGQGIYRALRTAELAAVAAEGYLAASAASTRPLREYHRRWSREVAPRRWVQRGVHQVMGGDPLRGFLLRRLRDTGGLAQVIRVTGDIAPVASLLHPSVWFRPFPRMRKSPDPPIGTP